MCTGKNKGGLLIAQVDTLFFLSIAKAVLLKQVDPWRNMAFSIDNLLKKRDSTNTAAPSVATAGSQESTNGIAGQNSSIPPICSWPTESGRATEPLLNMADGPFGVPQAALLPPQVANQPLPTLADLQLLFGGGGKRWCISNAKLWIMGFAGPKAHYRRNRRSGADRKPRQAYSSKQLEKLEDEFKVRDVSLNEGLWVGLMPPSLYYDILRVKNTVRQFNHAFSERQISKRQ